MDNLTKIEFEGLHSTYNLGDAHTRKLELKEYESIITRFSKIFDSVDLHDYSILQEKFVSDFSKLIGQSYELNKVFLCYSSSTAMEILANVLSKLNIRSVALVEPTFDNIPDILLRHKIEIIPFSDKNNYDILDKEIAILSNSDAIFLTVPNNPTGEIISKESFTALCRNCALNNTLLIVDACFRLFSLEMLSFDMKTICDEYQVEYIIIEDTGKYWPLHDLKIGMITCSDKFADPISDVHSDFLLNVSPFILGTLIEYINVEFNLKERPIINVIENNRKTLKEIISKRGFTLYNANSTTSVELIDISSVGKRSSMVCELLKEKGVIVLPGKNFYWSENDLGEKYIRISLAREPEYFRKSMQKLLSIVETF